MGQYGQTISIKHFLNKKVKGKVVEVSGKHHFSEKDLVFYPVYIRITVRRQMTEIKSVLNFVCSENEFERIKSRHSIALQKEINLITECLLKQNPFAQDRFSLKQALLNFQFENQPIGQLVNYYLLKELKYSLTILAEQAAQRRLELREADYYYTEIREAYDPDGMLIPNLQHLADTDISMINWEKVNVGNLAAWWMDAPNTSVYNLYHSYPEEFWLFEKYSYELYGTEDYLYTIKDWINGNYQKNFVDAWAGHPDPKGLLAKISTGLNILISKYPDLQSIISRQLNDYVVV